MEDLVYSPQHEELVTVENAFQIYKALLDQKSPETGDTEEVLAAEWAFYEELNARLGFEINLSGVPECVLFAQEPDVNGQPRPRLRGSVNMTFDEEGAPLPRLFEEKRILSVNPWTGQMTVAGLRPDSPHYIFSFYAIESIEVTEPLAA